MGKARNLLSGEKHPIAAIPKGTSRENSARFLLELCLELVLCCALNAGRVPALHLAAFQIASLGGDHKTGGRGQSQRM